MRHLLFFVGLLFFSTSTYAQKDYSEWLSIGVYMPAQYFTDLDAGQKQKLETKIISIIADNGISANISAFRILIDTSTTPSQDLLSLMAKGIVCVPKFEIYSEQVADTGLKKLKVVDVSLTLTVQYIYEDVIFSNTTSNIQGSGNTTQEAINNAIRIIKTSDGKWKDFLETTHKEIIRYYDNMCPKLMDQAEQLNKLNLTSEALSILWPIPKEINCHSEVENLALKIYQKHVNQQCKEQLLEAEALLAGNRYDEGLAVLSRIDPISECYEATLEKIKIIEKELDENPEKNRSDLLILQQQQLDIEKYRTDRIMELAATQRQKQFGEIIGSL